MDIKFEMNKKVYKLPELRTFNSLVTQLICDSQINTPISGDDDEPPGGWGPAQSKHRSDGLWNDDDAGSGGGLEW